MVDDDFLKEEYTYALVIRGEREGIRHLKEIISRSDVQVIYQKSSVGSLYISESKHDD